MICYLNLLMYLKILINIDEKFKFYLIIDTLIILIYSELEINLVYIYIVISKIL